MKERYMIEFALLVCESIVSGVVSKEGKREGKADERCAPAGLLFGQCNSKIILAQLTHGEFPYSPVLLLPFTVAAIGVNTPLIGL